MCCSSAYLCVVCHIISQNFGFVIFDSAEPVEQVLANRVGLAGQ